MNDRISEKERVELLRAAGSLWGPPLNPDGTPEEVVVRTIDDCTPDELRDLVTATLRLLRKPDAVVEGNS